MEWCAIVRCGVSVASVPAELSAREAWDEAQVLAIMGWLWRSHFAPPGPTGP